MSVLNNVIINNPVVIKDVKINKEQLNKFNAGKLQIKDAKLTLLAEIEAEKDKLKDYETKLLALVDEKNDLQSLISQGHTGLTAKLVETQKKIIKAESEIKEIKESLTILENMIDDQTKHLEHSLYNEHIENGSLMNEFNRNAEALQLQYYSLLYKAFEVANQLQDLGNEYLDSVNNSFRNTYPYKSFVDHFPANSLINQTRNNFPSPTQHCNAWGKHNIEKFTKKFEKIEINKDFVLYE